MKIKPILIKGAIALGTVSLLAACAGGGQAGPSPYRAKAIEMMKKDFQSHGIAKVDRLNEDPVQAVCNKTDNVPDEATAKRMQAEQLATVKLPADGKFMGDWQKGEKIAQSGKGFTWKDDADDDAGGGCYNCHQLSPKETSFGTIGPSLRNFGKRRGKEAGIEQYVYSKIYNAKAFTLCSHMPRFGHIGALKEAQIKDLVALILSPDSPVNK